MQLNGNIESENGLLQVTNIMSPVLNRIILYTNLYNSPSRKAQNNKFSHVLTHFSLWLTKVEFGRIYFYHLFYTDILNVITFTNCPLMGSIYPRYDVMCTVRIM